MVEPDIFVPGLRVIIEDVAFAKTKYDSFIRGYRVGQYLILDHPLYGQLPAPLGDGLQCIIRFVHQGQIVGFRTEITASVKAPYPLLFVRYPGAVERSQLRKADRYPVRIQTIVSEISLDGRIAGYPPSETINISKGGCQVESFEPMERSAQVFLTFILPELGQVDDVPAEVRACLKKGDGFHLGLLFKDRQNPAYQKVDAFLDRLIALQVRP